MQSYLRLLNHVLENGESHDDRTGTGTLSVFGYQWRHDLRTGFPLLTTKKLPLRWIAEELRWFLSGSTYEPDLRAQGVDIWKEWATPEQCAKFGREEGNLGPVYGELWRKFPEADGSGTDQIRNLIEGIMNSPNSRRLIVSGWHPVCCNLVALPPCHTLWQVKCHGNTELSLHLYARSIDSFLGLPFNIASYALLAELLAYCTGRIARDLIISFGDLHIYKNHIDQVKLQLSREPRELPRLMFSSQLDVGIEGLLGWRWSDIHLVNYRPHPKIEAEVAV